MRGGLSSSGTKLGFCLAETSVWRKFCHRFPEWEWSGSTQRAQDQTGRPRSEERQWLQHYWGLWWQAHGSVQAIIWPWCPYWSHKHLAAEGCTAVVRLRERSFVADRQRGPLLLIDGEKGPLLLISLVSSSFHFQGRLKIPFQLPHMAVICTGTIWW